MTVRSTLPPIFSSCCCSVDPLHQETIRTDELSIKDTPHHFCSIGCQSRVVGRLVLGEVGRMDATHERDLELGAASNDRDVDVRTIAIFFTNRDIRRAINSRA